MDFVKKYWLLILILTLVAIYFAFKARIDKWLGMAKSLAAPSWASCSSTFFVKLPNGKNQSVNTTDEGTTGNPIPAYYKKDVTLTKDGVGESGAPVKITKAEFDSLCQYKYDPPYAWYTEKPHSSASEGHGRKMAMGGIADGFWNIGQVPSSGTYNPGAKAETKQCWANDWYDSSKRHFHIEIWSQDCNGQNAIYAKGVIQNAISKGFFNTPKFLNKNLNDLVNALLMELNQDFQGNPQFKMSGNGIWGTSIVVPNKGPIYPNAPKLVCKSQTFQTCPGEGGGIAFYENEIPYEFDNKNGKVCCYHAAGKSPINPVIQFPVQCDPKHHGYDVYGQPRIECGFKPNYPHPIQPKNQSCADMEDYLKYLKKELENLQHMWTKQKCNSSEKSTTPPITTNCHATKVINGATYTLMSMIMTKNGYQSIYINPQTHQTLNLGVTKQEYDNYIANCASKPIPIQPIPVTCDQIQLMINNVKSKIEYVTMQLEKMKCAQYK